MKISFDWLSDYVDLRGLDAEAVAQMLTMAGLEVEAVAPQGSHYEGVVVGKVLATRPHPEAGRLTLCDVDLGSGQPVQIVCGAPNVAAGQKVPVARVGATLELPSKREPGAREKDTLARAEIRGERSEGMICSAAELRLSDDASGILVLDGEAPIGQPFRDYLRARGVPAADVTLDVAITPNRPDAASHIGIARDLAALTRRTLSLPSVQEQPRGDSPSFGVRIKAPAACPRYVGLGVRDVRVAPSPPWLQARLRAVGLRPINNVVDVTNYVMYEVGQPLHAFDLDRLAGDGEGDAVIVVRQTEAEEAFRTLDGQERRLPPGTLLICDAARPVAVAGVMGGAHTEVTDETTRILIESAYFDPVTIRRTARALGIQTDSSYRFERGVDPERQAWAAARAADLITEIAGGTAEPVRVDAQARQIARRRVALRHKRVRAVLGTAVPRQEVRRLLGAIGFGIEDGENELRLEVPPFRPDIEREVDVIEEVARLYGYDRIPLPGRMVLPSLPPRSERERVLRGRAADILSGLGLRELYTNSLLPAEVAHRFARPALTGTEMAAVVCANPINRDMAALRPSLLPGLLAAIGYNQNRDQTHLRVFEIGNVFGAADDPDALVAGYAERQALIVGLSGAASLPGWNQEHRDADFFDLKGIVQHLLAALGMRDFAQRAQPAPDALTTYRLLLEAQGQRIAVLARLADEVADAFELREPLFFAELDWTRLARLLAAQLPPRYTPIARYPEVVRDIALLVDRAQPAAPLLDTIHAHGGALLLEARLFDLYEGERVGPDKKSLAFSLRFGAGRTLTDDEVEAAVKLIVDALASRHNATLRR